MLFGDINEIALMGNITNDPDLRFTPSGTPVLSFGMATNRRYKKGEEWEDEATYHNIVVWSNLAQSLSKWIKKGTRVHVKGRIQVRSWDGTDGKRQYKTEIIAEDVNLISRYNENAKEMSASGASSSSPMASVANSEPVNNNGGMDIVDQPDINPDDLPF